MHIYTSVQRTFFSLFGWVITKDIVFVMIPACMDIKEGSWTHMQAPEKGQKIVFIRQRAYGLLKHTRIRTRSLYPMLINGQKTISTGTKANMMSKER